MNIFDARNPHMVRTQTTLDSRNPSMRDQPTDPRHYTSEYVYQEYPKYVQLADGTGVIVENAEEEAAARGDGDVVEYEIAESESEIVEGGESAPSVSAPVKKRGRPSAAELAARSEREKLLAEAEREEAEGQ